MGLRFLICKVRGVDHVIQMIASLPLLEGLLYQREEVWSAAPQTGVGGDVDDGSPVLC